MGNRVTRLSLAVQVEAYFDARDYGVRGAALGAAGVGTRQAGRPAPQRRPRYLALLSLRKYSATEPSQPGGTLSPPGLRTLPPLDSSTLRRSSISTCCTPPIRVAWMRSANSGSLAYVLGLRRCMSRIRFCRSRTMLGSPWPACSCWLRDCGVWL